MAKKRRPDDFDLRAAVRRKEFTPKADDAEAIVALVADGDEDDAKHGTLALLRIPEDAARAAEAHLGRLDDADEGPAVRLCRLLARFPADAAGPPLLAALARPSMRIRRAAAIALGKVGGEGVEASLLAALPDADPPARRAIVEALGKVGGETSAELLAELDPGDDTELARILERSRLLATRDATRARPVSLDRDARPERPLRVELRCRTGLESVLLDELLEIRGVSEPEVVGRGRLRLVLSAPPSALDAARTHLELRFPLPVRRAEDVAVAVTNTLTSPTALALLATFTRGTPRLRLDFDDAGKQRALIYRIASLLAERGVVNDPREAPWEARIASARDGGLEVALVPRGFEDPRFDYRKADVPAASHPTIAAALARLAGVREDDVVWDPFTGSGSELIERARLGPCRALLGTDLDPRALEATRANLEAAGVTAELTLADATTFAPRLPPTLVISNPPMGRRVHRGDVSTLLARTASRVAEVAAADARIAWLDPTPAAVEPVLEGAGFRLERTLSVDLGGFDARFELWRRGRG